MLSPPMPGTLSGIVNFRLSLKSNWNPSNRWVASLPAFSFNARLEVFPAALVATTKISRERSNWSLHLMSVLWLSLIFTVVVPCASIRDFILLPPQLTSARTL